MFLDHTQTPHSVGLLWTSDQPDAETSNWQHTNTHKRQTSMPPVGFEPAIPESARSNAHALNSAATAIGFLSIYSDCYCHSHKALSVTTIPRFLAYLSRNVPRLSRATFRQQSLQNVAILFRMTDRISIFNFHVIFRTSQKKMFAILRTISQRCVGK
jgi:hypothetical protein